MTNVIIPTGKTNEELIAELNLLREEQKQKTFSSFAENMKYIADVAARKAVILSQIEDNCNPGLTKKQIEQNHVADWKTNSIKAIRKVGDRKINHYGDRGENTEINFTCNGKSYEVLTKKGKTFGQMQNFIDQLTDEEMQESLVIEKQPVSHLDCINLIFGGHLS